VRPIFIITLVLILTAESLGGQNLIYAISADFPFYRSQMIRLYPGGGLESTDHIQGQNPNSGVFSLVQNVKGICVVSNTGTSADGKYFVTTGMFNADPYFDAQLFEIDPTSSSANLISPPVVPAPGTIRDLCFIGGTFPGIQAGIYGIRGGVELVRFGFSAGSFSAPVSVGFFTTQLPIGYTAWGLTWTLCSGQPQLIITARGQPNLVKYYSCDPNTAALTFLGDILPAAPSIFSFANCGTGWFNASNTLWINGSDNTSNPFVVYKYNQNQIANWCSGTVPLVNSTPLPFSGRNIEDFCSELY
jgi:hypothetical protein